MSRRRIETGSIGAAKTEEPVGSVTVRRVPGAQQVSAQSNDNRAAAIDVGSHTVRLLIAAIEDGARIRPLHTERHVTRLARGYQEGGCLQPASAERSIEVLKNYAEKLAQYRVAHSRCGATGVFRKAGNAMELIERARRETGLTVSILSEREEAVISAQGMDSVLPPAAGPRLCFDLGGSTTEFLVKKPGAGEPVYLASLPLGAATVTEQFFAVAPTSRKALVRAEQAIGNQLRLLPDRVRQEIRSCPGASLQLAGTAGTVSTLAAMRLQLLEYQPHRINGQVLDRPWIEHTVETLSRLSLAQRSQLPGLEPGREDIILGGALIVRSILDRFHQQQMIVADGGLLEGLLLQAIEHSPESRPAPSAPLTWHWKSE